MEAGASFEPPAAPAVGTRELFPSGLLAWRDRARAILTERQDDIERLDRRIVDALSIPVIVSRRREDKNGFPGDEQSEVREDDESDKRDKLHVFEP